MPAQSVIKLRRDSAADWASVNPVLADGEVGLESDSGLVKYGNGTSAWTDLHYTTAASVKTKVQNATGSSIPKGSVVYISGANGDNPLITLADADTEATSSKTIGITETAIANGAQGYVIESGLITGLNTGSATAGQSVWLSSTAGGFVFGAPPAKPAHSVYLGVVTRSNTNNGTILVKVQNGYELNELHDVNAGSPTTGDVLHWNGTAWINSAVAVSEVTGLQTALDSKAALSGATFTGDVGVEQNLVVDGNLTVNGTEFIASSTSITIEDNLVQIAHNNPANTVDLGLVVGYNDGTAKHGGIVRDVSADTWKLFKGVTTEPATTVDFTQGSLDDLQLAGLTASSATIGDVSNTELQYLNGVTSSVQTQLDAKAPLANPTFTGTVSGITKTMVGLDSVDNTSDASKPISTATQTALDAKANLSGAIFTGEVSANGLVATRVNTADEGGQIDLRKASDDSIGWSIDVFGNTSTPDLRFIQNATTSVASFNSAGQFTATAAPATANTAASRVGYMGIPLSGAGASGAYTLVATDAGEMVYTTTTRTVTIPANASVPFEVGTSIVFISGAGATTTIAITSDTLLLAGPGTTGSRTLAAHGMATAVKVAATTWYISGNGLT